MPSENRPFRPRITVIGSSNADMIIRLPTLPARGETVSEGRFMQTFGGKGANQAVAAARAGAIVTFVSCLGSDTLGDAMLANFKADRINTDHVLRTDDAPSGTALVMFDAQGENYLAVAPGANYCLTPAHVDAAERSIAESAALIMQMELPLDSTLHALTVARKHGIPVYFNYAPVRDARVPISDAMTVLVVNELEAAALAHCEVSDVPSAMRAATVLRRAGPAIVIVTLGRVGAVVDDGHSAFHLPSLDVEAVDTTAAGDTFCGALAVAIVEGRSVRDATVFATVAASLSVTRAGAQPSIPRRLEIDHRLKEHQLR